MKFVLNHLFIFLLTIFGLFSCSLNIKPQDQPIAKKGILNLSEWDFAKLGNVKLKGEWKFYWKKLYKAEDLEKKNISPDSYIDMPSIWNNMLINGRKLDGYGFATFQLTVLLNKKIPLDSILNIRTKLHMTASEIFINGIKVTNSGKVGRNKESHKADTLSMFGLAKIPEDRKLNIILHISNFNHKKGGVLHDIYLGTSQKNVGYITQISADAFLLGILFIIAFYHIGLYLIRRKDVTPLLFAFFCINVFMRTASTGEKYITLIIPNTPYEIYLAIEYITYYLSPPLGLHFMHKIFPSEFKYPIIKFFYTIAFVFCLFPLITPINIYSHTVNVYIIITISASIIAFICITLAIWRKRPYAIILLFGFIALIISTINDILNTTEVIYTGYYVHLGIVILIFCQSIVLSIKFSRAFFDVEVLSEKLHENKLELEYKVEQRTLELKKAKEKAENANQLKDKFISLISHDLKSPISGVVYLLDMMTKKEFQEEDEEKDKTFEYINNCKLVLSDSLNMLEQLLNINRLKTGKLKLIYRFSNLNQLIQKVVDETNNIAKEKNIKISNNTPNQFISTLDPDLIEQVVLNLITNAIKFSEPNDIITVSLFDDGDYFTIVIHDNGVGIDESDIPYLFSPEVKTSKIGTAGEKGTGLGLPLCKDMVEAHKGEINVQSKKGDGTTFFIHIPKYKYIVLVAEDNQEVFDKIYSSLNSKDFLILHAGNGEEALYSLFNIKPHLILTDIQMPIMDGFQLLEELKSNPDWEPIPVIVMSSGATGKDFGPLQKSVLEKGANSFIPKPFQKEELVDMVYSLLPNEK